MSVTRLKFPAGKMGPVDTVHTMMEGTARMGPIFYGVVVKVKVIHTKKK
jgi:hypothetical protein